MALNETKSLCSVRNSPKTAVSTEPPSVTSGPERMRGEQAGQQPAALLGTAGFYPPARRSCKSSHRARTDADGQPPVVAQLKGGRECSKPRRLWAGSCCTIPLALLLSPWQGCCFRPAASQPPACCPAGCSCLRRWVYTTLPGSSCLRKAPSASAATGTGERHAGKDRISL